MDLSDYLVSQQTAEAFSQVMRDHFFISTGGVTSSQSQVERQEGIETRVLRVFKEVTENSDNNLLMFFLINGVNIYLVTKKILFEIYGSSLDEMTRNRLAEKGVEEDLKKLKNYVNLNRRKFTINFTSFDKLQHLSHSLSTNAVRSMPQATPPLTAAHRIASLPSLPQMGFYASSSSSIPYFQPSIAQPANPLSSLPAQTALIASQPLAAQRPELTLGALSRLEKINLQIKQLQISTQALSQKLEGLHEQIAEFLKAKEENERMTTTTSTSAHTISSLLEEGAPCAKRRKKSIIRNQKVISLT